MLRASRESKAISTRSSQESSWLFSSLYIGYS
jgi:hypothetical protein